MGSEDFVSCAGPRKAWWLVPLLCGVMVLLMLQVSSSSLQSAPKFVGSDASGFAHQGQATAVSGDGRTACIGGTGDNSGIGAVWMWTLVNPLDYSSWAQQGSKIVAKDKTGQALFGCSCSLNFNGSIAVIGGYYDNAGVGAAWVFTRNARGWYQQGSKYVGVLYTGRYVYQGFSTSIASAAANTFVTGGHYNSGGGAFWIFSKSGSGWAQNGGKMIGSGGSSDAHQGCGVSVSADATTVAVGGNKQTGGGAVWVFTRDATLQYQQQGSMFTASPASSGFGTSVALSADGNALAVGADNDSNSIGAMHAFTRTGGAWAQLGVKHVGSGKMVTEDDPFVYEGGSISISANGNVIAVGGYGDNNFIGAVWVWTRNSTCPFFCQYGDKWVGSGYSGMDIHQGAVNSLSLSSDASMFLVGGYGDNSNTGAFWAFHPGEIPSITNLSVLLVMVVALPGITCAMRLVKERGGK